MNATCRILTLVLPFILASACSNSRSSRQSDWISPEEMRAIRADEDYDRCTATCRHEPGPEWGQCLRRCLHEARGRNFD